MLDEPYPKHNPDNQYSQNMIYQKKMFQCLLDKVPDNGQTGPMA